MFFGLETRRGSTSLVAICIAYSRSIMRIACDRVGEIDIMYSHALTPKVSRNYNNSWEKLNREPPYMK